MFSAVNPAVDTSAAHRHLFIATMSLFESRKVTAPDDYAIKTYPTQAMLLTADSGGIFPRWIMNFRDDTAATQQNVLGIFRYYPEFGVYAMVRNKRFREPAMPLLIMDSAFHLLDSLPHAVGNGHDFQLLKTADGKWAVISREPAPGKYFKPFNQNYVVSYDIYDHDTLQKKLWTCGPDETTVPAAEWESIHVPCRSDHFTPFNSADMFHANSWDVFNWAPDSMLVAVSEKNDNKVRFWWIVDSAGNWVARDIFRLGAASDPYNSFSFPDEPAFQLGGGHNFRMFSRKGNTLLATYYDDEECDTVVESRGLVLLLDLKQKSCRVIRKVTQGGHSSGRGSMQVMLEKNSAIDAKSFLKANCCIAWGGWKKIYNTDAPGYFPSGDTNKRYWEISVVTPENKVIAGITTSDLGPYTHKVALNNSEYQAQAFYDVPVPHRPIQYEAVGNRIKLSTALVHPTWINGDTTSSITLPINPGETLKIWVRGKTDENMVGEIWERVDVSQAMLQKRKGKP